jgi:hypothetical protein
MSRVEPISLGASSIDRETDPEIAKILASFYDAFNRLDSKAMASMYHEQASFTDPAFPDLRGERIGMMWAMMCRRAKSFPMSAKPKLSGRLIIFMAASAKSRTIFCPRLACGMA